ncbi:MAG TPA: MBL fold metallo-hydrolase [Clostridiales bacterium]|nr:MBL fold metallo-hydrolase [Clostridiales bacterium]
MKLVFLGAAREVTGSKYLLEVNNKNYLIDCGMVQGPEIYEKQPMPVKATDIEAVFLTHSHIDHSGMLPSLVKKGFKGKIYSTKPSKALCKIMLLDSAGIQEFEAEWKNRKAKRGGSAIYEPIYTTEDAIKTMDHFVGCNYEQDIVVNDDVTIKFIDAGHLLGSSSVVIKAKESAKTITIAFSGDIGNINKPIIKDPRFIEKADYVVMESTYGDRKHGPDHDYVGQLTKIIERTFERGGNVVIPSFAVGRTQELLYYMREIKKEHRLSKFGNFKVYLDSPLAIEATKIFERGFVNCFDKETMEIIESGENPLSFPGLVTSVTADESKEINANREPKVIISASGMCEAGRIRHHLKHNLWRPECTIVFAGYQVNGTLGRIILDGADKVKLFNEEIEVNAEIIELSGTSSHADIDGLLEWAMAINPKPKHIFVTHGEESVSEYFSDQLFDEAKLHSSVPYHGEIWDLLSFEKLYEGSKLRLFKNNIKQATRPKRYTTYDELLATLGELSVVVRNNKGVANREIRELIQDIKAVNDKWKNR